MGLDVVEILMEIEDEFGICLNLEEFPQITTAGALCQSVLRQLSLQDSIARSEGLTACPTVSAFLNLRNSLAAVSGRSKDLIRPETPVEMLLQTEKRGIVWSELSRQSQIILPNLELSERAAFVHRTTNLAMFIAILVLLWPMFSVTSLIVAPFVLLLFACLFESEFDLYRIQIPTSCRTIAGMLSHATRTYAPRKFGKNELTFEVAWVPIQRILSEQLNIPLDEIKPESRLIQDLGMD